MIILQDVVELLLKGRNHVIFELPQFQTANFLSFKEQMRAALASVPSNNVTAATVDYRMLSGQLASYHGGMERAHQQHAQQIEAGNQDLKAYMNSCIGSCMSTLLFHLAKGFQTAGEGQLQQIHGGAPVPMPFQFPQVISCKCHSDTCQTLFHRGYTCFYCSKEVKEEKSVGIIRDKRGK